ncbi:phosphate acetyltransferase [Marinomonas mediterranea]|jgi:phosphotransacetylase (EC 2.3.1.8)|uniref:Phosphate acetyltransferase n=1 Tax=Marinomonas mediterranea (strain ATCC 700492 / JCM 21426 / NBRC 103028 / MMB-1) TaxID=717774 RepID=F2K3E3_MARM1|nr:phosphate acetyltransferase [Marinomonas mediterranea]ADZ91285.1 phosphate acetyltransferase [Marinomonas mediterranea MMB-1]WCN09256.1 phosphate acetyltransferase [Marinomonas mediterranea]WCN13338.1 phosphate acetyltransferase [Marinomonas mediterranea]WCN17406.1 phosphate acetyltransferase [Marinomonas mediterranea MMB-1]
MPINVLMTVPTGPGVGLTSVSVGLVRALEQQGLKASFFKPIAQPQPGDEGPDRSAAMVAQGSTLTTAESIPLQEAERYLYNDNIDELMEEVVGRFQDSIEPDSTVIVEGLAQIPGHPYATRLNKAIAKTLDADLVLVTAPNKMRVKELEHHVEIAAGSYGGIKAADVIGCILNKTTPGSLGAKSYGDSFAQRSIFKRNFKLLGQIPTAEELTYPRVQDVADYLDARIINAGEIETRRVQSYTLCARGVENMLEALQPGVLVFTPGDRTDIIMATAIAALNDTKIAALVLTGGYQPSESLMQLCGKAMAKGLPVLSVDSNSWDTAINMQSFNKEIPLDDKDRILLVKEHIARCIDHDWINSFARNQEERKLSPPAFRYRLIETARELNKRIVLPEGEEIRTIEAASICAERGIARPVLLGNKAEILRNAQNNGIEIGNGVEIIEPTTIREHYVSPMVDIRKHRGLTDIVALEQLEDNVVLGTMMLQENDVDGLVSGAVHTTANTIRPALQLVKTSPDASLVSSVFFMCLPDQVLVYGDCAINPDPTAEQLAEIAIQSADSASAFGITPKVAMISYSTGGSGSGNDVDKVREATRLAQEKRPDILIDGPLQYDAAIMEKVAKQKAPNSKVAGKATVFVFPDLNTGNTTYKAVQRSADVVSIGPMLQGIRKPVNDLSRGALVDDIVYTIAITAIQAGQAEAKAN